MLPVNSWRDSSEKTATASPFAYTSLPYSRRPRSTRAGTKVEAATVRQRCAVAFQSL
jgi:hypothetical protein